MHVPTERMRILSVPQPIDLTYKHVAGETGGMQRQIEAQIEQHRERLGYDPADGMVNLEGFGWKEVYKNKEKTVIGESYFEISTDIITEHPTNRSNFRPKLVTSRGHKALIAGTSKHRTGTPVQESMLTVTERGRNGELRSQRTISRDELFAKLSGYNKGRLDGLWFTAAREAESTARAAVALAPLTYNHRTNKPSPPVYEQIVAQREAIGFDETSLALTWQQGGLFMRASFESLSSAATLYGSLARRVIKVDAFDQSGRHIDQKIYDDNSEAAGAGKLKQNPSLNVTTFEKYINAAAETQPLENLQFELDALEYEKHRKLEARRDATRRFIGHAAQPAELTTSYKPMSREEAIDLLAGIFSETDFTPYELKNLREKTVNEEPPHIIKALQEIAGDIGKDNIKHLATTMHKRYLDVMKLQKVPLKVGDDQPGWIVRALAYERLRAQMPDFAAHKSTLKRTDPSTNGADAYRKRLEITDVRIGQRFFDHVAPPTIAWGKVIDESTGEETTKKNISRDARPSLMVRVERSIRGQIEQLIKQATEKEAARESQPILYDRELATIGRLLSRSVGK
jgi:hypothetical protein